MLVLANLFQGPIRPFSQQPQGWATFTFQTSWALKREQRSPANQRNIAWYPSILGLIPACFMGAAQTPRCSTNACGLTHPLSLHTVGWYNLVFKAPISSLLPPPPPSSLLPLSSSLPTFFCSSLPPFRVSPFGMGPTLFRHYRREALARNFNKNHAE